MNAGIKSNGDFLSFLYQYFGRILQNCCYLTDFVSFVNTNEIPPAVLFVFRRVNHQKHTLDKPRFHKQNHHQKHDDYLLMSVIAPWQLCHRAIHVEQPERT